MATTAKKTQLDPLDFLALDALLSDEERAIRDTVRRFVAEQVKPYVGEWFERGEVPGELISTTNADMPRRPATGSVFANTTAHSA